MAASPQWKVYDQEGTYQAACKEPEAAAALMGFYGYGATIRLDHKFVVWTEGVEENLAGESYDAVVETIGHRMDDERSRLREKRELSRPVNYDDPKVVDRVLNPPRPAATADKAADRILAGRERRIEEGAS